MSTIGKRLNSLSKAAASTARRSLDKKPHFVPLDFTTVSLTLGHLIRPDDLSKFHKLLNSNLRSSFTVVRSFTALNAMGASEIRRLVKLSPILVEYRRQIVGVLFYNFGSVGNNLFTPILNKTLANFTPSGGYNIGHLVSSSGLAKSPLQLKLEEIKGLMHTYATSNSRAKVDAHVADRVTTHLLTLLDSNSEKDTQEALDILDVDYGVSDIEKLRQTDGLISWHQLNHIILSKLKKDKFNVLNSGNAATFSLMETLVDQKYQELQRNSQYGNTIIELDLIKTISPVLNKVSANIVIIQDRAENQKEYGTRIEAVIDKFIQSRVITTLLLNEKFNSSFKDELPQGIVDIVIDRRKPKTTKKSKKESINASLGATIAITKGKSMKPMPGRGSVPSVPIRSVRGTFESVANIERLMRAMLLETITKNMTRPNLINRTGRFAASVSLQKIEKDRDGSLRAFLTYMKYPYATFAPGGAQGFRGYNPERLIGQSVREIAVKLVKNRMQTIIV